MPVELHKNIYIIFYTVQKWKRSKYPTQGRNDKREGVHSNNKNYTKIKMKHLQINMWICKQLWKISNISLSQNYFCSRIQTI